MKKNTLPLLLFPLVVGCSITEVASLRDPMMLDRTYKKVAVLASLTDANLRRATEKKFVDAFTRKGLTAVPASELMPPPLPDSKSMGTILRKSGVEAVLVVVYGDSTGLVVSEKRSMASHPRRIRGTLTLIDIVQGGKPWVASVDGDGAAMAPMVDQMVDRTVSDLYMQGIFVPRN